VGVGLGLGCAVGAGLGLGVGLGLGLDTGATTDGVGDGEVPGCLGPLPKESQLKPEWSQLTLPANGSHEGPRPVSQTRPLRPPPRRSVEIATASSRAPAADATRLRRLPQKEVCGA